MKTQVESPLGKMSLLPRVMMDLEMKGIHHKELLQGTEEGSDRLGFSVVQDLLN